MASREVLVRARKRKVVEVGVSSASSVFTYRRMESTRRISLQQALLKDGSVAKVCKVQIFPRTVICIQAELTYAGSSF